jgi:hypothetical protein
MFFEQIVVFSEVLQLVRKGLEVRLSPELMYRLHNVYVQLVNRLDNPGENISDAVILTILALASFNVSVSHQNVAYRFLKRGIAHDEELRRFHDSC